MAIRWSQVYADITNVLLETNGFQLGLISDAQFYGFAGEVLADFLSKTGIVKKIFNMQIHFSISRYVEPEELGELQAVNASQTNIERTSGFYLDTTDVLWHMTLDIPQAFREDELPPKTVEIYPAPSVEGNQISTLAGQGGYGTVASITNQGDFNTVWPGYPAPYPGFGVIAAMTGTPYSDSSQQGYGMLATAVPSTRNMELLGAALPANITQIGPGTYIELVPDMLVPYLKYGILQMIFAQDGELKDMQKQNYCKARYTEGVNLAAAIMASDFQE